MANSGTLPDFKSTGAKIQQRMTALETNSLTKSEAQELYLGKNESAKNSITANSATKALQDSNGNVIVETYALKSSVPNIVSGTEDLEPGTSDLETGTIYFVLG